MQALRKENVYCISCGRYLSRCPCRRRHELERFVEPIGFQPSTFLTIAWILFLGGLVALLIYYGSTN